MRGSNGTNMIDERSTMGIVREEGIEQRDFKEREIVGHKIELMLIKVGWILTGDVKWK